MKYQSLDDLYKTRRKSWIPVVILIVAAAVALTYFLRRGDRPDPEGEEAPATVGAEQSSASAPATSPGVSRTPAAVAPPPRESSAPYPAEELHKAQAAVKELEAKEDLAAVREALLKILEDGRALGAQRAALEQRLGAVNLELVTTPRPMPGKVRYIIQPNDSLSKIAAKYNCPAELIQKANRIANPSLIRPGNSLHVLDHPAFLIEVSKKDNTLLLTLGGRFFKRYRVGTGEFGRTPSGTFKIRDKIVEPPWWHPDGKVIPFGDKENILGTRWLALEATGDTPPLGGYGIHGTWDDASIGKAASAGCVRMHNADVEELHMLVPRGTPVVIRD